MSHSLTKFIIHLIFSTKSRIPFITETIKISLYQYMSSIAKSYGSDVYEICGVEDHLHMLINLPKTLTLSKLVEEIKKNLLPNGSKRKVMIITILPGNMVMEHFLFHNQILIM